ncbi:unnamed protein product [Effrenium voratum]|nr:unnamed protein product [Effrenium voratum]
MVAAYWRGLPRWIHWWLREAARPKQQLEQIGGLSALGHPPSWSCPGIGSKNILESADGAGASDNHGDETTSLDSPLGTPPKLLQPGQSGNGPGKIGQIG